MIIKLKEETLNDIIENGKFTCDGCACGEFTYQLNDKLWMSIYRSCRKASSTPSEKLWEIHGVEFYDEIIFSYYQREGEWHIDEIEEYGKEVKNVKLNKQDEKVIYNHLRYLTNEMWGNEYR